MVNRLAARAIAHAAIALAGGCTLITDSFLTNDFSGDPFPVDIDTSTGAIIVGFRQGGAPDRIAVLDLLSPITITEPDPITAIPSLNFADVTLLGFSGGAAPDLPRARFVESQVISLHPCDADSCQVGRPEPHQEFTAILGADALAGDDVRLRLGDNQLFILPDVGGDDRARSLDCDAVFRSPYRGGGTLVLAGTELPFGNRRIAVQACLGQDPDPFLAPAFATVKLPDPLPAFDTTTFNQHGANVLMVVSTSIGISILGKAAYDRYALAELAAGRTIMPVDETAPTDDLVYLPSGPIAGWRRSISRLALVAAPTSNALAPCRQLYAHRTLSSVVINDRECVQNSSTGTIDCPCKLGDAFCPVPAILELGQLTPAVTGQPAPAGAIDILVLPDTDHTLQALRTELRPDQPEVDGILGTDVLRSAEIDVDYPHDRLVARCATPGTCKARPQLSQNEDRCQINHCMYNDALGDLGCPAATPRR
jgi:hypothetical protein